MSSSENEPQQPPLKKMKGDEESPEGKGSGNGGDSKVKLYSYWRSSCSWRVRLALLVKGIEYEYCPIHLVKDGGEQLKENFASLNPSKAVPALTIDGVTLSQSTAILEYLEETRPSPPLLPKDPVKKAEVRRIREIISADIQPIQNLRVIKKIAEMTDGDADKKNEAKMSWARHWIDTGFEALENVLRGTAGAFCVGDDISLADLYIPGQVYNAKRFKVDMSKFPTIQKVHDNIKSKYSKVFEDATPEAQPDAQ